MSRTGAPLLFEFCLDRWGVGALWLSAALSLAAFGVLLSLPRAARESAPATVDSEVLTPTP